MTQDEIIEMAEKCGFYEWRIKTPQDLLDVFAFAKLVAQHEREACAQLADEWHEKRGLYGMDYFAKAIRARGQA